MYIEGPFGLVLGLMLFKATFNNISVISCCQFYWWRKPDDPEKTTDLSQVTDKLYHIMLYTSPWSGFELTRSVVIGTDCIGSCKSKYHMITAMTVPWPFGTLFMLIILKDSCWFFLNYHSSLLKIHLSNINL
jgi:hypothetical protein